MKSGPSVSSNTQTRGSSLEKKRGASGTMFERLARLRSSSSNRTERAMVLYVISQELRHDTCMRFLLQGNDVSQALLLSVGVSVLNHKPCPLNQATFPSPRHPWTHIESVHFDQTESKPVFFPSASVTAIVTHRIQCCKENKGQPSPRFQKTNRSLGKIHFGRGWWGGKKKSLNVLLKKFNKYKY